MIKVDWVTFAHGAHGVLGVRPAAGMHGEFKGICRH